MLVKVHNIRYGSNDKSNPRYFPTNNISANANFMLGYLKENFTLTPLSLKLLSFKTLIRSKSEYAAAIWDPGHSTLVSSIEVAQNRGARFISCNYHRNASVS